MQFQYSGVTEAGLARWPQSVSPFFSPRCSFPATDVFLRCGCVHRAGKELFLAMMRSGFVTAGIDSHKFMPSREARCPDFFCASVQRESPTCHRDDGESRFVLSRCELRTVFCRRSDDGLGLLGNFRVQRDSKSVLTTTDFRAWADGVRQGLEGAKEMRNCKRSKADFCC